MKNFLRVLTYIPASLLAFGIVLILSMLLFDFIGNLFNFTSGIGSFLGKSGPTTGSGISLLLSSALAGFYASVVYYSVGLWIFPDFRNSRYTKIGFGFLFGVIALILCLLIYAASKSGDVIQIISYIILLIIQFAAYIVKKDDV